MNSKKNVELIERRMVVTRGCWVGEMGETDQRVETFSDQVNKLWRWQVLVWCL